MPAGTDCTRCTAGGCWRAEPFPARRRPFIPAHRSVIHRCVEVALRSRERDRLRSGPFADVCLDLRRGRSMDADSEEHDLNDHGWHRVRGRYGSGACQAVV